MASKKPHVQQQYFFGGGEMGDIMRSRDWSMTPLGHESGWPQYMLTTLNIMLNSRFPMFVFWGPELVCFYNDAYRPSLGIQGKHPAMVGEPAQKYWQEIWHIIKPLIDQVLDRGEPTWSEDQLIPIYRNNQLEEVYWTFSYSPVRDVTGCPVGVLVTCSETTAKVNAFKNAEEEKRKFRNTVKQAPVGITILRGHEMIVEMANDAYLQIVDKKEDEFVGKSLFIALPEVRKAIEPLLSNVLNTGKPTYGNEFEITLNRHGHSERTFFNFVYQPLREEDGNIDGVIVIATEVTHQVEARFALQRSENEFRNLVTQSPVAMAIFKGPEFIIDVANETILKNIWQRNLEDVQGKKLLNIFPELGEQSFIRVLKDVSISGKSYKESEAITLINTPTGSSKFYLDFECAPISRNEENVSCIMVTIIDVTEKVESRNKINNAEQSLRLAIEAANMGTFDWNLEKNQFSCSIRLKEIFGFAGQQETTHNDLIKRFHPDDKEIRDRAVKESYIKGGLVYEARVQWNDQSIHWVRVHGKIVRGYGQEPLRMYGTVMDITEQKTVLEELKESETKFRLLADSMPQHIWTSDAAGNLNYFNQSVLDYSGLAAEQINADQWIQIIHPDDREENMKRWIHAVDTGQPFLFEHRFRRHDGQYRWQLSRAIPQKDEQDKIQMWVGTSTDIHDRKLFIDQLESMVALRTKELRRSNEALLKTNSELAQFAYVASHDLQEPLRKIKTFIGRILDSESQTLSARGKDYFNRIQVSSIRMQKLISDLLAFSRTTTITEQLEKVDLNIVLRDVKDQLRERIEQSQAKIDSSLLPSINGIPFQFEQLFTNIISNSLKYSRPNIPAHIIIRANVMSGREIKNPNVKSKLEYHEISFTDNGIGFDSEFSEKIFHVFQRLHGKDAYDGTGIGLAICRKIMDNHHGVITATAEPDKGATFTLYIPIK